MDRASDYESAGRVFESPWARHKIKGLSIMVNSFFCCSVISTLSLRLSHGEEGIELFHHNRFRDYLLREASLRGRLEKMLEIKFLI